MNWLLIQFQVGGDVLSDNPMVHSLAVVMHKRDFHLKKMIIYGEEYGITLELSISLQMIQASCSVQFHGLRGTVNKLFFRNKLINK